jgi:hypothetical protein
MDTKTRNVGRLRNRRHLRLSDIGLSVDAERMVAVYRALRDIADERKIISDEDLVTVVKSVNEAAVTHS